MNAGLPRYAPPIKIFSPNVIFLIGSEEYSFQKKKKKKKRKPFVEVEGFKKQVFRKNTTRYVIEFGSV